MATCGFSHSSFLHYAVSYGRPEARPPYSAAVVSFFFLLSSFSWLKIKTSNSLQFEVDLFNFRALFLSLEWVRLRNTFGAMGMW